jgi:poly(glycerol-phosphate) alpha-glucosyltransferase
LKDSVEHEQTGFLVPHGDVAALATRIEQLLGNPTLRARLSEQAIRFAQQFTWERAALRTERFLAKVAEGAAAQKSGTGRRDEKS